MATQLSLRSAHNFWNCHSKITKLSNSYLFVSLFNPLRHLLYHFYARFVRACSFWLWWMTHLAAILEDMVQPLVQTQKSQVKICVNLLFVLFFYRTAYFFDEPHFAHFLNFSQAQLKHRFIFCCRYWLHFTDAACHYLWVWDWIWWQKN